MGTKPILGLSLALFLAGCAGMPDERPADEAPVSAIDPGPSDSLEASNPVVRVETGVGTLMVRQKEADTVERLLCGELVGRRYMAVALAAE